MFKKIIVVVTLCIFHPLHTMRAQDAHQKVTYLLNSALHTHQWVLDVQTGMYNQQTSSPNIKNICQSVEEAVKELDPASRMLLLFNDPNMLKAIPFKLERKDPIVLSHGNEIVFTFLNKLYKKYATQMYVAFITYAINKCKPQHHAKLVKSLGMLPTLKKAEDWQAILNYNNQELKTFARNFAISKTGTPQETSAVVIKSVINNYYPK